jgi:long-chain acyl-CoA synthetase
MFKSHDMRVSPDEIEQCIYTSNLVSHVVAFAIDKNDVENEIVAAVVPPDPASFTQQTLDLYCNKEMPEYLRPQVIQVNMTLPQTSPGKPDRGAIKKTCMRTSPPSTNLFSPA